MHLNLIYFKQNQFNLIYFKQNQNMIKVLEKNLYHNRSVENTEMVYHSNDSRFDTNNNINFIIHEHQNDFKEISRNIKVIFICSFGPKLFIIELIIYSKEFIRESNLNPNNEKKWKQLDENLAYERNNLIEFFFSIYDKLQSENDVLTKEKEQIEVSNNFLTTKIKKQLKKIKYKDASKKNKKRL